MEARLQSFAHSSISSWEDTQASQAHASEGGAGGANGVQAGARGAGGTSSAPAPERGGAEGPCDNAVLNAAADCAVAAVSRGPARVPAQLACVASAKAAYECLVDQYLEAQAQRAK